MTQATQRRGGVLWSEQYTVASSAGRPRKSVRRWQADAADGLGSNVALVHNTTKQPITDANLWPDDATTVMIRNISNRYTQEDLLDELASKGFHAAFDYFHLVMDMHTKRNKGYAFLNLRSPALARQVHSEFHLVHLDRYKSPKMLEVALAAVQGFQANVISYLHSHTDRVQNAWFKPIIFVHAPGQTPDWKAMPLTEANLPPSIAQVCDKLGFGRGTRSEVRERMHEAVNQMIPDLPEYEASQKSLQKHHMDNSPLDESLDENDVNDLIESQVQAFLSDCAGANQSKEALLSALEKPSMKKPRRKRKGNKKHDNLDEEDSFDTSPDKNHGAGNEQVYALSLSDVCPYPANTTIPTNPIAMHLLCMQLYGQTALFPGLKAPPPPPLHPNAYSQNYFYPNSFVT